VGGAQRGQVLRGRVRHRARATAGVADPAQARGDPTGTEGRSRRRARDRSAVLRGNRRGGRGRSALADRGPRSGRDRRAIRRARGRTRILVVALRIGPWGDGYGADPDGLTLAKLAAQPNGIDMGPLEPRLPGLLQTKSGRIELAPPYITGDLPRLRARLARRDA